MSERETRNYVASQELRRKFRVASLYAFTGGLAYFFWDDEEHGRHCVAFGGHDGLSSAELVERVETEVAIYRLKGRVYEAKIN